MIRVERRAFLKLMAAAPTAAATLSDWLPGLVVDPQSPSTPTSDWEKDIRAAMASIEKHSGGAPNYIWIPHGVYDDLMVEAERVEVGDE